MVAAHVGELVGRAVLFVLAGPEGTAAARLVPDVGSGDEFIGICGRAREDSGGQGANDNEEVGLHLVICLECLVEYRKYGIGAT